MKYMMNFFMHVKVMLGGYFVLKGVEYPSTDLLFFDLHLESINR